MIREARSLGIPTIALIDTDGDPPEARPGISALKLWPDALAHLGHSPEAGARLDDGTDKRRLEMQRGLGPVPLRRIYLLADGTEHAKIGRAHV